MHTLGGGAEGDFSPSLWTLSTCTYTVHIWYLVCLCMDRIRIRKAHYQCGAVEVPGPARENVESENNLGEILGMANIGKKPGGGWGKTAGEPHASGV